MIPENNGSSEPPVGRKRAIELLRGMRSADRRRVLRTIGQQDPALRASLEDDLVFFEDLCLLSDDEFSRLVLRVWHENQDLWVLALKRCSGAMHAKVLRTMSETMRERTRYRLETLPPRRLSDVHRAQKRIVQIAKELFGDELILDLRDTVR